MFTFESEFGEAQNRGVSDKRRHPRLRERVGVRRCETVDLPVGQFLQPIINASLDIAALEYRHARCRCDIPREPESETEQRTAISDGARFGSLDARRILTKGRLFFVWTGRYPRTVRQYLRRKE